MSLEPRLACQSLSSHGDMSLRIVVEQRKMGISSGHTRNNRRTVRGRHRRLARRRMHPAPGTVVAASDVDITTKIRDRIMSSTVAHPLDSSHSTQPAAQTGKTL
jgi:hypothetical protein